MRVSVVLFTADLRMHDHPPLRAALAGGGRLVPLFVRDTGIATAGFGAPNREAFLRDCLADLDAGLRSRGGRLVLRSGDVVEETCRVAAHVLAGEVHVSAGASGYAQRREERLRAALERDGRHLVVHEAVTTVLPPGAVTPSGGGSHFAVFTPYFRAWSGRAPGNRCRPRARCGCRTGPSPPTGCPCAGACAGSRPGSRSAVRRAAAHDRLAARRPGRLRGGPRRPRGRRHLALLTPSALRHAVAGRTRRPGARGRRAGRGGLRAATVLARLPPPGARGPLRDVVG